MNHYTTKLLTSFLLRIYIFFFLFHSNYTRDPSLFLSASFFRVTCTRMNSDSVAQLNCLRLVEPYNRAGITHTFNHYTTTITTTTATATTATTTSPRPPPPPPLLHILSTAYRYIHAHGRIHTTELFEPAETARAHSLTAATSLTPGTRYFTDSHCLTHTLPSLLYKTVAHRCLSARTCKSL